MYRSLEEITGCKLQALDGAIGKVKDFYFEDDRWFVRYLVADTGEWLYGRQVLLSPLAVTRPDWTERVLPVRLTRNQIHRSPSVDEELPVTRRHEIEMALYYGWPFYWGVGGLPTGTMPLAGDTPDSPQPMEGDPHLRSFRRTAGYFLEGRDGRLGRLDDFIIKTDDWSIVALVAAVKHRDEDKRILLSLRSIERVAWNDRTMHLGLTAGQLNKYPRFDPHAPAYWQREVDRFKDSGRPAAGG